MGTELSWTLSSVPAAKRLLKTRLPALYGWLFRIKNQLAVKHALAQKMRAARQLDATVLRAHRDMVASGPFRGMRYTACAAGVAPKVLGTYERELHDWIVGLSSRGYECVVNVGCAEGYYAVGLARL